ncbi:MULTISPECIES: amino acid adenylation domain-containing protein [unclassified Micromonospora]|uniref:amino acid adenylation domain-containing protein n=1 Tax=unclassified Micromonospora TaxID=2617518 RepID=UPI002FF2C8CC
MTDAAEMDATTDRDTSGLEDSLARIWGDVLGAGPVERDVDFIALGGNSLHAARVTARVRALLAAEVTVRELFESGTVRSLAERIAERRASRNCRGIPPLDAFRSSSATDSSTMPSPQQRRLWFLDHLHPGAGVAYNVPAVSRVRGPLDLAALRAAIDDLVRRHSQLRTRFFLERDRLTAEATDATVAVDLVDVSGHDDPVVEAHRQVGALAMQRFDLGSAPLLRCAVWRLSADDHLVALVFHHLVADGWTVDLVDRDLAIAYAARTKGRTAQLPDLELDYADFARWQHHLASSPQLTESLDYWRRQLAGVNPVLELPTDRPRPAIRAHSGRRLTVRTTPELASTVRDLASGTGTTCYAVFLAALAAHLRRLTGRRDLLVATPTAGRPDPRLEDVVGFFANTLLVRLRPGAGTFRDLVSRTHATVLDGLDRQYVPFEQLVREFAPPGDLSRSPLAQVALAYQGPRRERAELAGATVEPVEVDNGTAKFDLTIEVHEVSQGFELTAEYDVELFGPERAEAILDELLALLATAVARPDIALAQLVGDRPAPRPARSVDDGRCLHELFETVAARSPESVAVVDGARRLTYRELDRAANRFAHRLRRAGVGREQLVALCAERSVDLIVGVLAILKAGAGYLPLDPRHPAARHRLTLDDAGCAVLLGDAGACDPLRDAVRTFLDLGDSREHEPEEAPHTGVRPHDVAYVIYTSGSTGRPKGVVITHGNVTRLFSATERDFSFGPDDVWTLFHSIAFDFSVWELWGALLYGGRLVVVSHEVSRDPTAMLDLVRGEGVTVMNQTPTAFRQLAATAEDSGYPSVNLRHIIFGGEALDPASLRGWVDAYGTGRPHLINMYGITETTVHVTIRPIEETDLDGAVSPIGRPIPDLRVHVLDEHMREVPVGVEGEMYVGGPGVARGYLNRPDLTAARFVPDPFGAPGDRLYRSGDLAVRVPDGSLEYRGRIDQQVKLHGFRIELGEIERALLDQPGVRTAACLLREDCPGLPRIVGYLVSQPGWSLDTAAIRAGLGQLLPAHMVPAVFVELPALPVTGNGKLDRRALPAPGAGSNSTTVAAAPQTPQEHRLARLWSEALGVPRPGRDDNFFALGGDSIVAVRVGALARAAGLPVTVEQIFLHPTIAELATACLQAVAAAPPPATELPLPAANSPAATSPAQHLPADVTDAYPLAAMQLAILFECELAESPGLYHDLLSVRVSGPFDPAALDEALTAVAARHDVLRTSIDLGRYQEPLQLVHRAPRIPVSVESVDSELADPDETPAEAVLRDWWRRELAAPFDLTEPPLLRCHVLRRSERRFQLSLSVHHSLIDGWSFARLMTEVLIEYDRLLGGVVDEAVPPPVSRYRDFVAAEQAAAADPAAERFWRGYMRAHPAPELPAAHGSPSARREPVAFRGRLGSDLDAGLRRVAAAAGLPVKSVFLAAHLWALARLTGRADVVTGLQVNGRLEEPGADRSLGLFLNITPLGLHVDGTWEELARAAFEAERLGQPYRRFPLAQMRQLAGRSPFEVVFNYTDFHVLHDLDALKHVSTGDWWSADRHSFPLMVEVVREPDRAGPEIVVSAGLDSPHGPTGAALGGLVVQALERIAAEPASGCRYVS